MIKLMPVALGGVVLVCIINFSIKNIVISEKKKMLTLASIIRQISFNDSISKQTKAEVMSKICKTN